MPLLDAHAFWVRLSWFLQASCSVLLLKRASSCNASWRLISHNALHDTHCGLEDGAAKSLLVAAALPCSWCKSCASSSHWRQGFKLHFKFLPQLAQDLLQCLGRGLTATQAATVFRDASLKSLLNERP